MIKNVFFVFLVFLFFLLLIECEYTTEENKEIAIGASLFPGSQALLDITEEVPYEHNGTAQREKSRFDSEIEKKSRHQNEAPLNNVSPDVVEEYKVGEEYSKNEDASDVEIKSQKVSKNELYKETVMNVTKDSFTEIQDTKKGEWNEKTVYMEGSVTRVLETFETLYEQEVRRHVEIVDEIFLRIMHQKNCNFLKVLDEYSFRSNMNSTLYNVLKGLIKQIVNSNTLMFADRRKIVGVFKMVYKNNMDENVFKRHFLLSVFRWYNVFKIADLHVDNVNYIFYLNKGKIYSHKYVYKILMDFLNSENFLFYINLNKFPFLEILTYYNKYNFQINNRIRNNYPLSMYNGETFNEFIYTYFLAYNNKFFTKHRYLIQEEEWKNKRKFVEKSNQLLFQKVQKLNKDIIMYTLEGPLSSLEECVKKEIDILILTFEQLVQDTMSYVYNVFMNENISENMVYKDITQEKETWEKSENNVQEKDIIENLNESDEEREHTRKGIKLEAETAASANQHHETMENIERELLEKINETYDDLKKEDSMREINNYILNNFDRVFNLYSQYKNIFENYKNRYELENGYIINTLNMRKIELLFDPMKNIFNELNQLHSNRNVNFYNMYIYLMTILNFDDKKNFYDGQLKCHMDFLQKNQKGNNKDKGRTKEHTILLGNQKSIEEQKTNDTFDEKEENLKEEMEHNGNVRQRDFYNHIDLSRYTPAAISMKDRIYDQLKLLKQKYVDKLQNDGKCVLAFLYLIGINDNEGKLKFPYGFPRNIDKSLNFIKEGNAGLCNFLSGFLFHINLPVFVNNTNVWLTTEMNDEELSEIKQNSINTFFYIYHKQKKNAKVPPFLSNESRLFPNESDFTKSKIISYALGSTKNDIFSKLAFTNNVLRLKEKNKMNLHFRDFFDFSFDNEYQDASKMMTIKNLSPFITSCDFLLNNIVTTVVESLKTSNILESSVFREEISENNKNLIENSNDHTKNLFEYFLKLADNRNSYALAALGEIYFLGNEDIGVERDEQKAFEYWKKAADQGDSISALSTGYAYLDDYKNFSRQEERIKAMTPEQLKQFVREETRKEGGSIKGKKKGKEEERERNKGKTKNKEKKAKTENQKENKNKKENEEPNEQAQLNQQMHDDVRINGDNFAHISRESSNFNENQNGNPNEPELNNFNSSMYFGNEGFPPTGTGIDINDNLLQTSATFVPMEDYTIKDASGIAKEENINANNGDNINNGNADVNVNKGIQMENNVDMKKELVMGKKKEEDDEERKLKGEREADTKIGVEKEEADTKSGVEKEEADTKSGVGKEEADTKSGVGKEDDKQEKETEESEENQDEMVSDFLATLNEKTNRAFKNAEYYFLKAIKHNDDSLESILAKYNIYKFGLGREKNIELAGYYLKRAADKGDSIAQMLLGHYYAGTDIGVIINDKADSKVENLRKSYKYYEMSAQSGNLISLYNQSVLILKGISPEYKTFQKKCQKTLKHFHFITLFNDRIILLTKLLKRSYEMNDYVGSLLLAMMLAELGEHTSNVNTSFLWKVKKNTMENFLKRHNIVETMLNKLKQQVIKEELANKEKKVKRNKEDKQKNKDMATQMKMYDLSDEDAEINKVLLDTKYLQQYYNTKIDNKELFALPLLRNCVNFFFKKNVFFYIRYCNYVKRKLAHTWNNQLFKASENRMKAKQPRSRESESKDSSANSIFSSIIGTEDKAEREYNAQEFVNSFKQIELYEKYDKIIFSEINKVRGSNVKKKIKIIEEIKGILFEHFRKTEFLHCYYRPISFYQVKYMKERERLDHKMIHRKTFKDQAKKKREDKVNDNLFHEIDKIKENSHFHSKHEDNKADDHTYNSPEEKMINQVRNVEFANYASLLENDDLQEIFNYEQKYDSTMFEEIQSFSHNCDVCKHYYDISSSYYGYNKASMELIKKYNRGDYFTIKSKRKELQYLFKNSYLGNHESLFYVALFFEYNKLDHLKNVLHIYMDLATDKHEVCNVIGVLGILKILFKKIVIDMNVFAKKKNMIVNDELKQYILFKTCPREDYVFPRQQIEQQCVNYKAFLNDTFIYSELSYWNILRVLYKWFVFLFKGE